MSHSNPKAALTVTSDLSLHWEVTECSRLTLWIGRLPCFWGELTGYCCSGDMNQQMRGVGLLCGNGDKMMSLRCEPLDTRLHFNVVFFFVNTKEQACIMWQRVTFINTLHLWYACESRTVPICAMEAFFGEEEVHRLLVLDFGTRWRWALNKKLPVEIYLLCPLDRRQGEIQR